MSTQTFKFEIGERVVVNDEIDMFMHDQVVTVTAREFYGEVEVYSVVDSRGWHTSSRVEKLVKVKN